MIHLNERKNWTWMQKPPLVIDVTKLGARVKVFCRYSSALLKHGSCLVVESVVIVHHKIGGFNSLDGVLPKYDEEITVTASMKPTEQSGWGIWT
jgi:hypothetical protein